MLIINKVIEYIKEYQEYIPVLAGSRCVRAMEAKLLFSVAVISLLWKHHFKNRLMIKIFHKELGDLSSMPFGFGVLEFTAFTSQSSSVMSRA